MSCIPPSSDCGCLSQVTSECVFYKGDYLSCVDVTHGDDLTNILKNIDSLICSIPTPTGVAYVGTPNQIDVTGNVIGLSSTVTTQISNLQSNVTALQSCSANTVKAISTTTSGMTITQTSSNACGKSFAINYTPSATPITEKQGIIDNYVSTTLTVGYEYIKDIAPYAVKAGDILRIKGTIKKAINQIASQDITIYNGSNLGVTNTLGVSSTMLAGLNKQGNVGSAVRLIDFEIILTIVSNVSGNITYKTYANLQTSLQEPTSTDKFYLVSPGAIQNYQFTTPIALTGSVLALSFVSTDAPVLEQFIVELIRKI